MATKGPLFMLTDDLYPLVCEWWQGHGFPAIPRRRLPPVSAIHTGGAFGCLYMDNGGTGVAMMEWLVTDPAATARDAYRALCGVVEFLKATALEHDYDMILTTCRQPSLANLLERMGFTKSDKGMIHLFANL